MEVELSKRKQRIVDKFDMEVDLEIRRPATPSQMASYVKAVGQLI